MIYQDISNGIIPVWHDESIVNKYFISHQPKVLDPGYNYDETMDISFERKIIWRDKMKYFTFAELNRKSYKECLVKHNFGERVFVKGLNCLTKFCRIFSIR